MTDLAPLTTADLDEATLEQLFIDLTSLTEILQVMVKGGGTDHAGDCDVESGRRALLAGARGMQIRYRWQDAMWLDTLMRTAQGVRIVRTRLPAPEEIP